MPELPEVESVARALAPELVGVKIGSAVVQWRRMLACPSYANFQKLISGREFLSVGRRGKYIVCNLRRATEEHCHLLIHLRMSGHLEVVKASEPLSKHHHVIFSLHDGRELRFYDPRKFGRVYLVNNPETIIGKLGPEPLEESFRQDAFVQMLRERKGAIKPLLLNQTFIAGLGNIYADEVLWRAKIHPLKPAYKIKDNQARDLFKAIRKTLNEATSSKGTDFGDGVVKDGYFRPRVYDRTGRPCHRCGESIVKIVVGQRGTHFCKRCQSRR